MSQLGIYNNVKGRGDWNFYILLICVDSSKSLLLFRTLFLFISMAIKHTFRQIFKFLKDSTVFVYGLHTI